MAPVGGQSGLPSQPQAKPAHPGGRREARHRSHSKGALSRGGQFWNLGLERHVELGGLVSERAQMLDHTGILPEKRRQDVLADPDALVGPLLIRRVLYEGKPSLFGIRENIGATTIEQRTDHSIGPPCLDPDEASKTGAPKNPREHGLGLIILGVPDRDARRSRGTRDFVQRLVTMVARASLNRCALLRYLDACRPKRNPQGGGEVTHLHDL